MTQGEAKMLCESLKFFYYCIRVFINELLLHREQKTHFIVKIKTLPVWRLFQWNRVVLFALMCGELECVIIWRWIEGTKPTRHCSVFKQLMLCFTPWAWLAHTWISTLSAGIQSLLHVVPTFARNEACSIHMTNIRRASNGITVHIWNIALLDWPVQRLH